MTDAFDPRQPPDIDPLDPFGDEPIFEEMIEIVKALSDGMKSPGAAWFDRPEPVEPPDRVLFMEDLQPDEPVPGLQPESDEGPATPAYPCVIDPFSARGIRRLARDDPYGWRERLHVHLPAQVLDDIEAGRSSADATLKQLLLAYSPALLPPAGSAISVETTRRARQVLAAVVEHDGDMTASDAAEMLPVIRTNVLVLERAEGRRPLSRGNVSRAMSLVRAALNSWRAARGEEPLPEARPAVPARPRPPRRTVRLRVVWQLSRLASPWERIKLALAVGIGLREPEIEALRVGDLIRHTLTPEEARSLGLLPGIELWFLRVRDVHEPDRVRWMPLPPWVAEVILAVPLGDPSDLLVPEDRAPSLTATLRRLRPQVRGGRRVTPSSLRLTWQAMARHAGCSREVVRGTWRQRVGPKGWPRRWHRAQVEMWLLAGSWADFCKGVAERLIDQAALVPRKARPGCGPADPEIRSPRSQQPAPLPSRMRELPPEPPRRPKKSKKKKPEPNES